MLQNKAPERLWYYGLVWISNNGNLSVSISRYASGKTPLEDITGERLVISDYLNSTFYDLVTYRANAGLG